MIVLSSHTWCAVIPCYSAYRLQPADGLHDHEQKRRQEAGATKSGDSDADGEREVDWRREVCGYEPVGACGGDRFGSEVEHGDGADGDVADGAGRVHGDRHRDHFEEEAAEAGSVERDLLGRASGGSTAGLDEI